MPADHQHSLKCVEKGTGRVLCGFDTYGEIFLESRIRKDIAHKGTVTRRANVAARGPCPSLAVVGTRARFIVQCTKKPSHEGMHHWRDAGGSIDWVSICTCGDEEDRHGKAGARLCYRVACAGCTGFTPLTAA